MLLISSLVFVLGTVAVLIVNGGVTGEGVRFGYEQLRPHSGPGGT